MKILVKATIALACILAACKQHQESLYAKTTPDFDNTIGYIKKTASFQEVKYTFYDEKKYILLDLKGGSQIPEDSTALQNICLKINGFVKQGISNIKDYDSLYIRIYKEVPDDTREYWYRFGAKNL